MAILLLSDAVETCRHMEDAGAAVASKIKSLAECVEARELSKILSRTRIRPQSLDIK